MKSEPLITVIVPVYNVESYLEFCVNSILCQSYKNLEVILIDDGSTDNSGKICDDLKKKDSRIKVFHQPNGGLSSARNVGLDNATGEYVAFVDSDDSILPDMYEDLLELLIDNNGDVVECGIIEVASFEAVTSMAGGIINSDAQILDSDGALGLLFVNKLRFEVWNKLYRWQVISKIRYKVGQVHEDVYFTPSVLMKAKRVIKTNNTYYRYLLSRPGNTNSSFKTAKFALFDEFKGLIAKLKAKDKVKLVYLAEIMFMGYILTFYKQARKLRLAKTDAVTKRIEEEFKQLYTQIDKSTLPTPLLLKCLIFSIMPGLYYRLSRLY